MLTAATTRTEARSNLSTIVAVLTRAGFKAAVESSRPDKRRAGFTARFKNERGVVRGVWLFDHCAAGEFAGVCAALESAGYALVDASGGSNFVQYGCARVLNT